MSFGSGPGSNLDQATVGRMHVVPDPCYYHLAK